MDFDDSPDEAAFRAEVRALLAPYARGSRRHFHRGMDSRARSAELAGLLGLREPLGRPDRAAM